MKRFHRLSFYLSLGLLSLGFFVASSSVGLAKGFPRKPIRVIVPYSPGGDADLTARVWADFAEKQLGQPVIVVNKTGGGGVAGATFAAHARPNGYTLFLAQAGSVLIAPQTAKTTYSVDSFQYISRIMIGNCGMIAHADAKWADLKDFVSEAQTKPNSMLFASPGAATWLTLAIQHWEKTAKVQMKHVQHQGSAPAVTSLLGKHTHVSFVFPQNYIPQVKSGSVKLLALGTTSERFPNVPSFAQLGFPGSYIGWGGVAAPKGTPDHIIEILAKATKAMTKNADFNKALKNIHAEPSYLGPQAWSKIVHAQFQELSNVIDDLGIRAQ